MANTYIILRARCHPKHFIFSATAYHSTMREGIYCYTHFTKGEKGGTVMVRLLFKIIELVSLGDCFGTQEDSSKPLCFSHDRRALCIWGNYAVRCQPHPRSGRFNVNSVLGSPWFFGHKDKIIQQPSHHSSCILTRLPRLVIWVSGIYFPLFHYHPKFPYPQAT